VQSQSAGLARDRERRVGGEGQWLRSLGAGAFNYRETSAREALADGIDVYFDNVGGQLEPP
jgi:hypothetical protein